MVKQPANEIEVTRSGPVLNICPNRPASRNALTWAMYEVMSEALADAETDAAMRVIQFSGAGDGFGAGNEREGVAAGRTIRADVQHRAGSGRFDFIRWLLHQADSLIPGSCSVKKSGRCARHTVRIRRRLTA